MATLRSASSNAPAFFSSERGGDVLLYATSGNESQRILIGNTSNTVPALTLEGATATVAGTLNAVESRSVCVYSSEIVIGTGDPRITEFSATHVPYTASVLQELAALRVRVAALESAALQSLYQYLASQTQYPLSKLLGASLLSAWGFHENSSYSAGESDVYSAGGAVYIPDPRTYFIADQTIGPGVTLVFDMAFKPFQTSTGPLEYPQFFSLAFNDMGYFDSASGKMYMTASHNNWRLWYVYGDPNGLLNIATGGPTGSDTPTAVAYDADYNVFAVVVRPLATDPDVGDSIQMVQYELYVNGTQYYTCTLATEPTSVFLGLNVNDLSGLPDGFTPMPFGGNQFLATTAFGVIQQAVTPAAAQALTTRSSYRQISTA